jgi:hypothetical protein
MPFDKSRYPKDWPAISARIKERDGWCCKQCGVRQYAVGYWVGEAFRPVCGCAAWDNYDYARSYKEARYLCDHINSQPDEHRYIVIVLTVAHLRDPDPMNCADDNLAALCQRCHNRLDMPMRQSNARRTRATKAGQSTLPMGSAL